MIITVICIAAALAPFLIPSIPVATDLPKHVLVANVIAHYHDPQLGYDRVFDIVLSPRPTVLGELCLALFAKFFDPFVAAKMYLAVVIVGLWVGGLYLSQVVRANPLCAVLLLPLAHTFCIFSGFLPFAAGVAVFPFLLGVLIAIPAGWKRTIVIAVLLLISYGFHIAGAAIGCLAVLWFAVLGNGLRRIAWLDVLSIVPTVIVVLLFVVHRDSESSGGVRYYSAIGQVRAWLGYNAWALSRVAGVLFIVLFTYWILFSAFEVYRKRDERKWTLLALVLVLLGLVLPYQIGDWFVVGSRTLPFVVVLLIVAIPLRGPRAAFAGVLTMAFLLVSGVANTRAAMRVQPLYAQFLSGLSSVSYGSRILPIIPDLWLGGNKYILPFGGIEDAYNVYRGGSNPYCLASRPRGATVSKDMHGVGGYHTGAQVLEHKYLPLFAYKYSGETPDYSGAQLVYQYAVLYGTGADIEQSIASQGQRVYKDGPLSVYRLQYPHSEAADSTPTKR